MWNRNQKRNIDMKASHANADMKQGEFGADYFGVWSTTDDWEEI